MGGNAGFWTGYTDDYSYRYNDYLGSLAGFYTRSLNYCPGNIWNARLATQMWERNTHNLAFPYGQYYNFTGTPRYVVASCYELPYHTALGLHGYSSLSSVDDLRAKANAFTVNHLLSTKSQSLAAQLKRMQSIGQWKDSEYLQECEGALTAEESQKLKDEAKELEAKVDKLNKKLEIVMKNEAGLEPSAVLESVRTIEQEATSLETSSIKDLADRCREAAKKVQAKKTEAAKAKQDEEATAAADEAASKTEEAASEKTEEKKQEYKPTPAKTSTEKAKVMQGTKVKVKNKSTGATLSGTYYEYNGKIYKIESDNEKPIDMSDKVEKIPTT